MDDELEERLASYRPVMEQAMARRPLALGAGRDRPRWAVSAVAAATVAAGVVGWVALGSGDEPASTGSTGTTAAVTSSIVVADTPHETTAESCDTTGEFCVTGATVLDDAEHLLPGVWAYGDFVMAGADALLLEAGYATNVSVSRQFSDLAELVPVVGEHREYQAVVIHAGNNGAIDADDLDVVMQSLSAVPRLVVLTIDVERPWAAGNNELIRALPARYPNVIVLDWDELAEHCSGVCFAPDGFHLTAEGAEYYTALITNLLDRTSTPAP